MYNPPFNYIWDERSEGEIHTCVRAHTHADTHSYLDGSDSQGDLT